MKAFKLDNEPKITSGFKVPDDYFENLEISVLNKITKVETPVFTLWTKRNWMIAVAAIFVISVSIPVVNKISSHLNSIDETQLENYLSQQSNLSEDDIVELLDEEKIRHIKLELNVDSNELEESLITNPNIEEYLTN